MLVYRGFAHSQAEPTALTIGNFDGLHLGHRALLQRLKALAQSDGLCPAVLSFEPHAREFFSPLTAPVRLSTLREKLELIASEGVALTCVCRFDAHFAALSAEEFIERLLVRSLQVKHLLIGDDFRFGAGRQGDQAMLRAAGAHYGFQVEAMDSLLVDGLRVSSSAVRSALAEGRMADAARLLGRPYAMDGRVVTGRQLGRQLGVPTANIRVRHRKLPLRGVFAVEVHGPSGGPYQGIANVGHRPSIENESIPLLEAHLFDFSRDLYGSHLSVRFLHKLREETRFPNLEALKAQIAADIKEAKSFFTAKAQRREGRKENAC